MSQSSYQYIMKKLNEYTKEKGFSKDIVRRIKRIIELENSFLLGITEIFSNNLDYIFRYLYVVAFILQVTVQFTFQNRNKQGWSALAAIIVVSLIFIVALSISIITYRKKTSNIDTFRAIKFYFTCKCFKTQEVLENYE